MKYFAIIFSAVILTAVLDHDRWAFWLLVSLAPLIAAKSVADYRK